MRKLELVISGGTPAPPISNTYQKINFDSSNADYIDLGNMVANNCRTIEFWYTPSVNITSTSAPTNILSRYQTNNNERITFTFFSGKLYFSVWNGSGSNVFSIGTNSNSWNAGTEYHFALKISSTDTKIYVNEVLQTSTSTNTTPILTSAKTLYLGGLHGLGIRYLNGAIRNLQFWSIERDVSEIGIDKDTYYSTGVLGLIETYHFTDETGFNVSGVNGNIGTIHTSNSFGASYVDNTMREDFTITYSGSISSLTTKTKSFDLYKDETIAIQKKGINIDNISETESGTTNKFSLPYTPNNNKIFNYLELIGSSSQFPYQDNFVKYTEGGIELITNGRLKVSELSEKGYEVDIVHGINDFFDKIRGKFLWEAYEPHRVTLQQMVSAQTTLCNTTAIRDTEGYCVPLMDLAGINPIADYQQTCAYYLNFGLEKISENIDYSISFDGVDLTDYAFTYDELPNFESRVNNFSGIDLIGQFRIIQKDERIAVFKVIMRDKAEINFQQIRLITNSVSGYGTPVDYEMEVMVNDTSSLLLAVNSIGTYSGSVISPTYLEKGDVVEVYIDTSSFAVGDAMNLQGFFSGLYSTGGNVYHENILKDYSQTDFIKEIMKVFNLGVNVDAIRKEIEFYSLNDVVGRGGVVNDLSRYYDKTKSRVFSNEYGKNNIFKYKYVDSDSDFANGIMTANNNGEEKTILSSGLTASINYTSITLGAVDAKLTTVKGYAGKSVDSKPNKIGNRINKVVRILTNSTNPVQVDYINSSSVISSSTSDQTYLSFSSLGWSDIINSRYNNLRDNVLNRYEKYIVYMNAPIYVINEYDFKEKVYIKELASNFVVNKISTMKEGVSEWELIKIN